MGRHVDDEVNGITNGMHIEESEKLKTSKPEHNDKNINLLANELTELMDVAALQQHYYESQVDYYYEDKEAFETDWQDTFDTIGEKDE